MHDVLLIIGVLFIVGILSRLLFNHLINQVKDLQVQLAASHTRYLEVKNMLCQNVSYLESWADYQRVEYSSVDVVVSEEALLSLARSNRKAAGIGERVEIG